MQIINKDITQIGEGVICHQVNCQKKMGSGLAKAIRSKYPSVYDDYMKHDWQLGDCQIVPINDHLMVANLAGQDRYGYDGEQYTDYSALRDALITARIAAQGAGLTLYIPFGIGCGLGGGEWTEVSDIIEEVAPNAVVCKYESN